MTIIAAMLNKEAVITTTTDATMFHFTSFRCSVVKSSVVSVLSVDVVEFGSVVLMETRHNMKESVQNDKL